MIKKEDIKIIHNFISEEEQAEGLRILSTHRLEPWSANPTVKVVPLFHIDALAFVSKQVQNITTKISKEFGLTKEFFCHDSQIGTWDLGKGSGPHTDTQNAGYVNYSSILYLTGDYEGGEIEFPEQGIQYKPEARDLIIFPCKNLVHEVYPVTSGNRSTVVGFYSDVHLSEWRPDYDPETYNPDLKDTRDQLPDKAMGSINDKK
jgi:hypothetical protein